jgi:hypothetical protein
MQRMRQSPGQPSIAADAHSPPRGLGSEIIDSMKEDMQKIQGDLNGVKQDIHQMHKISQGRDGEIRVMHRIQEELQKISRIHDKETSEDKQRNREQLQDAIDTSQRAHEGIQKIFESIEGTNHEMQEVRRQVLKTAKPNSSLTKRNSHLHRQKDGDSSHAEGSYAVAMVDKHSPTSPKLGRSSSSRSSLEFPEQGFVINFRRLIWMTQLMNLLHELIKSTAIAALTLVAGASGKQMVCSCIFIVLVFITYARHEMMHDSMDINDVKNLVPLMADDEKLKPKSSTLKLLRSLSLHSRWTVHYIGLAVFFLLGGASVLGWLCHSVVSEIGEDMSLNPFQSWSQRLVGTHDDAGNMAMQLIILDIMTLLEFIFECIQWRETTSVLSPEQGKTGWWPVGRPSLWFTSEGALRSLRANVVKAQMGVDRKDESNKMEIYPHELACYALLGEDERLLMAETLKDLGTTLVFYDNKQKTVADAEPPDSGVTCEESWRPAASDSCDDLRTSSASTPEQV